MARRLTAAQRARMFIPRTLPPAEVRDWRLVHIPGRLKLRPRDSRGFIIPYSVDDGTFQPDFRMTQPDRVRELLANQNCWLCGLPRTHVMCFIGGPLSISNRLFSDGWMHDACAAYAIRVCPFLSRPTGQYSKREVPKHVTVLPLVAAERPQRFGIAYTRSFKTVMDPERNLYLLAGPFTRIHWFSIYGRLLSITSGNWEQGYDSEWKKRRIQQRRQDGSYAEWRQRENARVRAHRHRKTAERRAQRAAQQEAS